MESAATHEIGNRIVADEEEHVLQSVRDAAREETSWESGLVFNTLCCRPHPLALKAFAEFADRNLLKEQSTAGRRMEREVVREYSSWFGANDFEGRNGYVCSGGTEGNFVALWSAKAKHSNRTKIVVSRYAHYSYDRFAFPLGLSIVSVPLNENLEIEKSAFLEAIDSDTLAVIVTAGDPVLGRLDPLLEIVEAARAHGCSTHVDGAYGGYFLPFLDEYRAIYQQALAPGFGVDTLTLDPHKYGLCPLGTGLILFSDKQDLDQISFSVPFPPIEARTFQGSRSGGPSAAAWAMLQYLGRSGYADLAESVVKKRIYMEGRLRSVPGIECVVQPRMTSVGFRMRGDESGTRLLYDKLCEAGYRITPQVRPAFFMRIIAHHHTEYSHIDRLVEIITRLLEGGAAPGGR
jgi:glutamate/tyrosine decarboxylase-like PLP-dependent enzyme